MKIVVILDRATENGFHQKCEFFSFFLISKKHTSYAVSQMYYCIFCLTPQIKIVICIIKEFTDDQIPWLNWNPLPFSRNQANRTTLSKGHITTILRCGVYKEHLPAKKQIDLRFGIILHIVMIYIWDKHTSSGHSCRFGRANDHGRLDRGRRRRPPFTPSSVPPASF